MNVGNQLVSANLITYQDFQNVMMSNPEDDRDFIRILASSEVIEENKLLSFLSEQFKIPVMDKRYSLRLDQALLQGLPPRLIEEFHLIPMKTENSTLHVATYYPVDRASLDEIKMLTGKNIVPWLVPASAALKLLEEKVEVSEQEQETDDMISNMMEGFNEDELMEVVEDEDELEDSSSFALEMESGQAPVVKVANYILLKAVEMGASDIHLEPYEKSVKVRFRIDGILQEIMTLPAKSKSSLVGRLKVMSSLDIAEKRRPQDGRIKIKIMGKKEVEYRVSTLPCISGEKVVLRVLDKSSLQVDLTKLGFQKEQFEAFKKAIHNPYGMVLVTGPTGSGKTTTLYSAISEVHTGEENITTAEDPVEFNLPGINQVQINEKAGLTFASALRSFLRQDPDVILVGEIRDTETAEIAIKAAMTGHLVLSTLHTNDAPSTIARLLDMQVKPYQLAPALNLVLAQRLARKICTECKTEDQVEPGVLVSMGLSKELAGQVTCYKGTGCAKCNSTGYKGRVGIYEVMPVSKEMRDLITKGASANRTKMLAIELGMKTLRDSALDLLTAGITSVEEVTRCTIGED